MILTVYYYHLRVAGRDTMLVSIRRQVRLGLFICSVLRGFFCRSKASSSVQILGVSIFLDIQQCICCPIQSLFETV